LIVALDTEKRENKEAEDELNRLAKEDHSRRERSNFVSRGKNFLEDGITVTSPTEIEFSDHFQSKLEEWKEVVCLLK
jgi:hypothetical protein